MKPTLARVAAVRGQFALLVFRDALRDGRIEPNEACAVGDALSDWESATTASADVEALSDAMRRGIADEHYRRQLVERAWLAIDELPPRTVA